MAPTRLEVQYPNRRALLASARTEGAVLSLFIPGSEHVAAGTDVTLAISIESTELRFELQGRVRLQLAGHGARTQPGLGVALVGDQKRAAAQMLAVCAGRSLDDGTALDSRHDVDVVCLVDLHGTRLKGAVKDVSSTGAFIKAPRLSALRGEADVTIRLEPLFGRWGGRVLKARVVWVGEKKGMPGFGVRFLDATAHVRESLKKHFPSPAR